MHTEQGVINMTHKDKAYLPKVRTDYHPSNSDCQSSTGVGQTTNIPNPASDPIVVNNIASQEFDYTQDLMDINDFSQNSKHTKKY